MEYLKKIVDAGWTFQISPTQNMFYRLVVDKVVQGKHYYFEHGCIPDFPLEHAIEYLWREIDAHHQKSRTHL